MAKTTRALPGSSKTSMGKGMKRDRTRLLLAFNRELKRSQVVRLLRGTGLVLERDEPSERINHTPERFWIRLAENGKAVRKKGARVTGSIEQRLQKGKMLPKLVSWVAPVGRLAGTKGRKGYYAPLPTGLLLDKGARANTDAVRKTCGTLGLKPDFLSGGSDHTHYAQCSDVTYRTSFDIRRALGKRKDLVQRARFVNMPMVIPLSQRTNPPSDPLFGKQWNLRKIGAPAAWDIITNNSINLHPVLLAVMDQGVEDHLDLNVDQAHGVDLDTMTVGQGRPRASSFTHGTRCAGIAAASIDNAVGIAGVHGLRRQCQILPLRCPYWTCLEIARGIEYAADLGEQLGMPVVITMSFGFTKVLPDDENLVADAIAQAHGKRVPVVLCAAAGNDGQPLVHIPARLPGVIACGASDQQDDPVPTSNFQKPLSVVAPGESILSTTNPGMGRGGDPDYDEIADTSAATAHLAGLAALLLSIKPTLTSDAVQGVIEKTADKVPTASDYTESEPHGLWSPRMGYGRINAENAVKDVT